jgi:radical SAM protein with 4Fe4S-binding SPASM domain
MQSVLEQLRTIYAVENNLEFETGIKDFIAELEKSEIISKAYKHKEKSQPVENTIMDAILKTGSIYSVLMELTYRCNEKCRHCYVVNDTEKELTLDEIKKALDELYDMNVLNLTFTGGDIFMREDIFDILDYAYQKNFLMTIFTNGIAISDSDFLRLAKYNLHSIHFSLYSHISEKHDYITQVQGSFDKTLKSIKTAIELGIAVNIKTIMMNYNYMDIKGLLDLSEELGATIQVGFAISPKNDGDSSNTILRINDFKHYVETLKTARGNIEFDYGIDYKRMRDFDGAICGAGAFGLTINPNGDVFPCNALLLKVGNVRKESIKHIWENSIELKEWRKNKFSMIEGCSDCELKPNCNFCPGTALNEKGSPYIKYDEACVLAKAKKEAFNL